jgi:hypothetical protein
MRTASAVNVYYHYIHNPNMSENQLEDYMAGYMSEDDDAQPQPEIHDSEPDPVSPTTSIYLLPRPIGLSSH